MWRNCIDLIYFLFKKLLNIQKKKKNKTKRSLFQNDIIYNRFYYPIPLRLIENVFNHSLDVMYVCIVIISN